MNLLFRATALFAAGALAACAASVDELSDEDRALLDGEVAAVEQALDQCAYDKAKADKLGQAAWKGSGAKSQSRCYRYVKKHLQSGGFTLPQDLWSVAYGASAADFIKFANNRPEQLKQIGLKQASFAAGDPLPKGTVIVWPRAMCGYSKKHGHIEIVCNDDGSRACSDFKNRIRPGCTPTYYLPIGDDECSDDTLCNGKSNGVYCSRIDARVGVTCEGGRGTKVAYCPTGKTCGEAGEPARVSGNGEMSCQ